MHACELVELAAVVAAHGPVVIDGDGLFSPHGIEDYWVASRCRLERWARVFKELPLGGQDSDSRWTCEQRPLWLAVMEEVFTGEVLARVLAAVGSLYDRHHGVEEVEPLTKSVFLGHLEARNRALTFLVLGRGIDADDSLRLNRLRHRVERWSDMLVGYVAEEDPTRQYAVDTQRARDFSEDLHHRRSRTGGRQAWPLLQMALGAAFRHRISPTSPNADLNARIATSVLACFPNACFDAIGVLRSLWQVRLVNGAADAEVMLASILEPTRPAASPADRAMADQMLDRLRRFEAC